MPIKTVLYFNGNNTYINFGNVFNLGYDDRTYQIKYRHDNYDGNVRTLFSKTDTGVTGCRYVLFSNNNINYIITSATNAKYNEDINNGIINGATWEWTEEKVPYIGKVEINSMSYNIIDV
jgi:hypothetical protein